MGTQWTDWINSGERPTADDFQRWEDSLTGGGGGGDEYGPVDIGDGSTLIFDIDHSLATEAPTVWVLRNSNDKRIWVEETVPTLNRVTLTFALPPGVDEFRVIVRN